MIGVCQHNHTDTNLKNLPQCPFLVVSGGMRSLKLCQLELSYPIGFPKLDWSKDRLDRGPTDCRQTAMGQRVSMSMSAFKKIFFGLPGLWFSSGITTLSKNKQTKNKTFFLMVAASASR